MQLRRFNEKGIQSFATYLDALRGNPSAPVPIELLDNPQLTSLLDPPVEAEMRNFPTRMEFARWLHETANRAGVQVPRSDAGFWAWLTLALFDSVCPPDKSGARKIKETPRYLPLLDMSRRYYRHALVGSYNVYLAYVDDPDRANALLCGPLSKLTDEAYRLFVENRLVVHRPAVAVLSEFYFDLERGRLKRGCQSKTDPGSIRRMAKVLTQFARTFDLDVIPEQRLISILPREFDQWRKTPLFDQLA